MSYLKEPISIVSYTSVSALGETKDAWENYAHKPHMLSRKTLNGTEDWVGALPAPLSEAIEKISRENDSYEQLDPSVLFALYVSRKALADSGWGKGSDFGVNFGSSRGATTLFEKYYGMFMEEGSVPARSSPTTTLGNISSWIAHDLQAKGPEISHSITCSTALHALLNACAWLQAGMAKRFLVGGSEAALTPFTLAQMKALKIYSREGAKANYPSRPLDLKKRTNTMVLGEGASAFCLSIEPEQESRIKITGIGYATETLTHNVSISQEADCFQKSMQMAMEGIKPEDIDGIVLHAPGTVKGDLAEFRAIEKIFGKQLPQLTSNKGFIGHTFGASGLLSLEMALLMLRHNRWIGTPFYEQNAVSKPLRNILVNAVGFGGNAVSVRVTRM